MKCHKTYKEAAVLAVPLALAGTFHKSQGGKYSSIGHTKINGYFQVT
jgi:hypothetical protein